MCPERPEHLSEMRTIDFAVDAARKKMDAQGLEYGALMDYEEGEEEIFLWFEMLLDKKKRQNKRACRVKISPITI